MLNKNPFSFFINNMKKRKCKEPQCSFCYEVLKPQEVYYVDKTNGIIMCENCMNKHQLLHIDTIKENNE